MNKKVSTLICALVSAGAATGVATAAGGGTPAPTAAEQAAAAARAHEALPGSQASLSSAQHAGLRLGLTVAADAAKALPGSDSAAFSAPAPRANGDTLPLAELGWKAHMVGGVVAARDPQVVEWAVDWPGQSDSDAGLLTWRMRVETGTPLRQFPRLGSVAVAAARAQLASNLDVLERVLGDAFERARIVVVPVDASASLFGLEADVRVSDMDAVKAHSGDVVNGLATGLVGDDTAVVEGLAINLIADDGARAGWFRTERTGVGLGLPDPALGAQPTAVDAEFPNLTGGPRTTNSVQGGPVGQATGARPESSGSFGSAGSTGSGR
jgi:hypothetical protein